ncbi:MAG TPA: hypothetical protein VJP59_04255 [Gemmatimonadota bacterium]|nr:hypothetical protein [Gemmatimonadota bacterium]
MRILRPPVLAFVCVAMAVAGGAGSGAASLPDLPELARRAADLEVVVEQTVLKWSSSGRLLGHLNRGTPLERLGGRGSWTRVGVHGWMWRKSLDKSGNAYKVIPSRENLRDGPNGGILGTLERGVEVRRVGGNDKWFEIEMIGWLPDSAVRPPAAAPGAGSTEESEEPREETTPTTETTNPPPTLPPSSGRGSAGRIDEEVGLRGSPGGPVVTTIPSGTVLRTVERRGAWTRVQMEGWVPSESVTTDGGTSSSPEAVALAPDRFTGRRVQWTLEHVALQKAEEWRTDFEDGEWYGLARVPGGATYVYLVVPAGLLEEFRGFSPFETIRIEGRVRSGRSELTGNPVVEVARLLP